MKRRSLYVGFALTVFLLIIGISVLAPLLAPYDPEALDLRNKVAPPSAEHLLGTDSMGRDVLSRVIYGGRESILLAFLATGASMLVGMVLGMLAGYYGGAVDLALTTISSIFQGLPGTTMLIALTSILGPGIQSLLIALTLTSWVGFSRIVRGEVMRVKQEYYVESARSMGVPDRYILLRHILPNIFESTMVWFTNRIGGSVLSVASLSYLGLGLQPPTPDWGIMIKEARTYFLSAPLLALAPGICIVLFVLSIHVLGDWLRDRADVLNERAMPI